MTVHVGGRRATKTEAAYRIVYVNDSLGLDQPKGARTCTAKVTLLPDITTRITR